MNHVAEHPKIYPWQKAIWQQLLKTKRSHRLAHSLLFYGSKGLGISQFAQAFIQSCLCMQPSDEGMACSDCPSCRWVVQHSHPDVVYLHESRIKVDDIRFIQTQLMKSSHQQRGKFVVIDTAESLTEAAANALLKIVEEPNPDCYFIFISHQVYSLPQTLVSRCQKWLFADASTQECLDYFNLNGISMSDDEPFYSFLQGQPLRFDSAAQDWIVFISGIYQQLLELVEDPSCAIDLSLEWLKHDEDWLYEALHMWFGDVNRWLMGLHSPRFDNAYCKRLKLKLGRLDSRSFYACYDQLMQMIDTKARRLNLNRQLAFDNLLLSIAQWAS